MSDDTTTRVRTGAEIAARFRSISASDDFLGFRREVLAAFLPWDDAEGIRADAVDRGEWDELTEDLRRGRSPADPLAPVLGC